MDAYREDLRNRIRVLGQSLFALDIADSQWRHIARLRQRRLASLMDVTPAMRIITGQYDPTGVICVLE